MVSFKPQHHWVSIAQPWALMFNCCSHFLPHLVLRAAHPDMSTEPIWRKPKPALTLFSSPVEMHFGGTFAGWQNWTTPCRCWTDIYQVKKNKKTPKTLTSETCIEARATVLENWSLFLCLFFLFSFAAKGPCKSCPLYLRLGVHCLTTGWEESMMGKTWRDLTLVGQRRQRERKEGNENEKLQTGRETKPAGGKILKYSQRKTNKDTRLWRHKTAVTVIKIRLTLSKHFKWPAL